MASLQLWQNKLGNYFRDLKLTKKIAYGYTLIIVISVLGTFVGLLLGNYHQKQTEKRFRIAQQELIMIHELSHDINNLRLYPQDLMSVIGQPIWLQHQKNKLTKNLQNLNTHIETFKNFGLLTHYSLIEELVRNNNFLEDFKQTNQLYDNFWQSAWQELNKAKLSQQSIIDNQRQILDLISSDQYLEISLNYDLITQQLNAIEVKAKDRVNSLAKDLQKAEILRFQIIGLSILCSITIAILLAVFTSYHITKPIKEISAIAKKVVDEQNFKLQSNILNQDELGSLSRSLNQMILWIDHYIEELKNAKKEADLANKIKGEFLANMSHEIRNPMNAILGFSDLLKDTVQEPRSQMYVQYLSDSGKTLLSLINDILDLSKIEAGKLTVQLAPLTIRSFMREIINIFSQKAQQKNIDLKLNIAPDFPETIIFDEVRLRQIFFNLISNAIKFTPEGYIKITLDYCYQNYSSIALNLIVEDTGIGIEDELQPYIFDPFVQSKTKIHCQAEGTGLGLPITRKLTEILGGTITLKSKVNQGTMFILNFPKVAVSNSPINNQKKVALEESFNQFAPLKILVADDRPANLELMKAYFQNSHHHLFFAQNGLEVIKIANQELPDLIFLDLKMPEMNGYEVANLLKQDPKTEKIIIILLTASFPEQLSPITSLCQGFLIKPFSRTELINKLKSLNITIINQCDIAQLDNQSPNYNNGSLDNNQEQLTEQIIKLPLLIEKLTQYEERKLTYLSETLFIEELQELADLMKQWSEQHHTSILSEYANSLNLALANCDLNHIQKQLKEFPNLKKILLN